TSCALDPTAQASPMPAPCPDAAKLDDAPTRPKLKLTNAAIKIARISHSPCFLEKGADGAPSMLWRLASACAGPRFGRRRRAFIRRSALAKSPRTATTDAIG